MRDNLKKLELNSLKHFLLPNQLFQVKGFFVDEISEIETQINEWVKQTKNVVILIGIPVKFENKISVFVTYIPAVEK
jgi:hypothetical protein